MDLPDDLMAGAAANKLRVFVGSGPSCAAGLPGWDEVISDMSEIVRRQDTSFSSTQLEAFLARRNHLDTAELFRATVGESAYFRFLRERYRRPVHPSKIHHAIARLPVQTFFTTNYDHLLEIAIARQRRLDPAVITRAAQLNYIDDDEVRVIKLHGDIDDPASIVLTRADYATYNERHPELADFLRTSLNGWTLLFIGFGLRDPNFERIYADARNHYDTTNRQAYAVMSGTNAIDRRLWHGDGLTLVPLARRSQVVAALAPLSNPKARRV